MVADIVEIVRQPDAHDRNTAEPLEQPHRRLRAILAGQDQVGLERQHLLRPAARDGQRRGLFGHMRKLPIPREMGYRRNLLPVRQQHDQLVGAQIERHDPLRGRRRAARPEHSPQNRQSGSRCGTHLRTARARRPAR
jgi:hypothetical protein